MELSTVWFLLIAVLWTGYLVLEGFDFGVGMLLPVLGRTDTQRRVLINSIGPVWDGNEVWLLNPFALLGGATTALIFLSHGAVFLALKTGGEVREKAATLAARSAVATLVVAGAFAIWTQLAYSSVAWTWAATAVAALALLALVFATRRRREGWAFIASAVAIVAAVVLIFGSMYPDVMPGLDPANSLTVQNASSSDYTLTIMTWVAALLTPLVLAYQGWTYWVFRKRISAEQIPAHTGLTFPG